MKENRRKLLWILLVALMAFELGFKPIGIAPAEKPTDLAEATYEFQRSLVGIPPKPLPSAEPKVSTESGAASMSTESVSAESLALMLQPTVQSESAAAAAESVPGSRGQDTLGLGGAALGSESALAEALSAESQPGAKTGLTVTDLDSEIWTYLDQKGIPVLQGGVSVKDREVLVKLAIPRDTPQAETIQHRNDALRYLQEQYGDRAGSVTIKATQAAQKDAHLVVATLWRFQLRRPASQIKLGLDLQGGTRIVMEAVPSTHYVFTDQPNAQSDDETASESASVESEGSESEARKASRVASVEEWKRISADLDTYLKGEAVTVTSISPNQSGVTFDAKTDQKEDADRVLELARTFLRERRPSVVLLDEPDSVLIKGDTIDRVREIMQRRVDLFGLTEPIIQTEGDRRVTIEIAGQTPEEVERDLGKPADLKLMFIDPKRYRLETVPIPVAKRDPRNPAKAERVEAYDAVTGAVVDHKTAINDPTSKVIVRGADMKDNSSAQPSQSGGWEVSFELKPRAADAFREFTSKHIKDPLPIVLNNVIESAPVIQTTIGAQGRITGNFSIQEANNLKTLLNAGALPIQLEIKENRKVSATLGAENVRSSLFAGILGLLCVYLFMILYYRLPGAIADVALTLYVGIVIAILVMFNAVLTLTGIAGAILGVGMAVDANILIFERMKEELRNKSLHMSLKVGFERAWTAIFDSNVSTLITASILWLFGSGGVRGFATTLIVSVLASLFTAVFVSRVLLDNVIDTRIGRHAAMYLGARPESVSREDAQRGRRPL